MSAKGQRKARAREALQLMPDVAPLRVYNDYVLFTAMLYQKPSMGEQGIARYGPILGYSAPNLSSKCATHQATPE